MSGLIKDMWNEGWLGITLLAMIIMLAILIPLSIYVSTEESKSWDEFKEMHSCNMTSATHGYTTTGTGIWIIANGQVGTVMVPNYISGKEGWLCDDGITYFRNK